MDTSLFTKLISLIRTKEELNAVKDALDAFLAGKFTLDQKDNTFSSLPEKTATVLKEAFPQNLPVETAQALTEKIKSKLNACPYIYITIAFPPTDETKEKLCEKVRYIFGPEFILDLTVDPNLMAGAVIIHNGMYKDLSMKKKLADVFVNQKEEINKLLSTTSTTSTTGTTS